MRGWPHTGNNCHNSRHLVRRTSPSLLWTKVNLSVHGFLGSLILLQQVSIFDYACVQDLLLWLAWWKTYAPSEHGQILQNTVMSMKDKKQVASTMIRHMPTGMGGRTSRDAAIGGVEWFRWEEMISPNLTYPTEFLWPFNQTTGVCNFGKLNYYLGKRAADEGRPSRYGEIDFCKTPNKICDSEDYKELKWIAGMRMARIKRKQHLTTAPYTSWPFWRIILLGRIIAVLWRWGLGLHNWVAQICGQRLVGISFHRCRVWDCQSGLS